MLEKKGKYRSSQVLILWLICCSLFIFSSFSYTLNPEKTEFKSNALVDNRTEEDYKNLLPIVNEVSLNVPSIHESKYSRFKDFSNCKTNEINVLLHRQKVTFDWVKILSINKLILLLRVQSLPPFYFRLS